nr:PilZ domain-containing protein [uncultured Pseudodesulfovibrio sp.]
MSLKVQTKGKGRKKSKQISSDPIDETALGFSISLKSDDAYAKKRNAIRISVDGLAVNIPRLKKTFEVSDISATGLGFKFAKPRIKAGVKIKMDLILKGTNLATNVLCQVRRHEKGNVGCVFVELDRAQDDAVHKIVLIGQKEQAARKAARKDQDFKLPS